MKLICELNDEIILGLPGRSSAKPRLTARAIVKRADGLYAMLYMQKHGLYNLPGGGMENGESPLEALRREVLEETGCICEKIEELGLITENRASLDYTQESYFYVVNGILTEQPRFTQDEQARNTLLHWCSFAELMRCISEPQHSTVQRKYIQARDMAALREYVQLLEVQRSR